MNGQPTLAARHRAVLERIAAAARQAGRDPASVRLLAVSKTFDADAVAALAARGQKAFGENYLQEALDKRAKLEEAARQGADSTALAASLQWHFIGPIQSNKTRRIAEAFDWVHSVESLRIARRLADQRPVSQPALNILLQVNVSDEVSKSGCEPAAVNALAGEIATLPRLRLRGLMAIPEPDPNPAVLAGRFAQLRALQQAAVASVRATAGEEAALAVDTLSMGMSGDLEIAIAEGSTLVRVGSALFGERAARAAR